MIAAQAIDRGADALAAELLAQAAKLLPRLSDADRAAPLDALERFLEASTPSRFLAAARAMSRAALDACIERLDGEGGRRAFADAMAQLRGTSLPDPLIERLGGTLTPTRAEGRRVEALASLLAAWRELAGRVSEDTERLRRELRAAGLRGRRRAT